MIEDNKTVLDIPSKKERENKEWYIPMIDYIIDKAIGLNSTLKKETESNLLAAEGILDNDTFSYVTKAFGLDNSDINLPTTVREVSLILPIKRRYLGEYIRQYKNFQVFHKGIDAIKQRNKDFSMSLEKLIAQDLVNLINNPNQDVSPPDINKFIKDFQDTYIDDKVVESQQILNLFDSLNDSELNYIKAFYYYWATEEAYSYRRIINDEVHKEIFNPLEYYRIPSGNIMIEDDDMGMRKYSLSFSQINEQFRDKLTDSDLAYLRSIENLSNTNNKSFILENNSRVIDLFKLRDEYSYFSNIGSFSPEHISHDLSAFTNIYHVVCKFEDKIGYLKYIDPFGKLQERKVEGEYKLNQEAGDVEIKYDYISRYYQAWRLGDKYIGVYIPFELIEPQRQDINIDSKCKSPYNGITGTFSDFTRNSICKILKQYEALYRIYHYQQERAISQFKAAITIIPESAITSSNELSRLQKLQFLKRDNTLFINDAELDANALQALRVLNLTGAVDYINALGNLILQIKNEALECVDMNPQRYGDINPNAGKGTTEQAISKAQTGSILLFTLFNKFVEKDKEADIDYLKVAWINGKKGSFFDKKTNQVVYVEVDGLDLYNRNIGIFCGNQSINDEKLQQYRNLAFSATQNGDYDVAADAIELENSVEIHRLIKDTTEKKRVFEQQMKEREAQAAERVAADNLANGREQRELEKYKIDMSYQETIDAAKIRAGSQVQSQVIKSAENIDKSIREQDQKENELLSQK